MARNAPTDDELYAELRKAAMELAEMTVDIADDVQPHNRERIKNEIYERFMLNAADWRAEVEWSLRRDRD